MKLCLLVAFMFALSACALALETGESCLRQGKAAIKFIEKQPQSQEEAGASLTIIAYIRGFRESLFLTEYAVGHLPIAIPDNVSNSQLIRVVVAYLEKRPAELHKSGSLMIWSALLDAFPNPKYSKP